MLIEETLRGGYLGLYGEVVTEDVYKLKGIKFTPTIFIDCGANIGVTSRFARQLFPECLIIAIEPHKENCDLFKYFTKDKSIILIEKAIANGMVWHGLTAANGSGETYLNPGVGFIQDGMETDVTLEESSVSTIRLSEIIDKYVKPEDKVIIKLDIEGNEHIIFFDEVEMNALRRADYIGAEVHFYARTGGEWQEVQDRTHEALRSLETTHECRLVDRVNFYATKKQA